MRLALPHPPSHYKSPSQRVRLSTERWAAENLYCPACPSDALHASPANAKVVDFECPRCALRVQLKGKSGRFGPRFSNSAYGPKVEAIKARNMPDYALLTYDRESWSVTGLEFVPGHFLGLDLIQRRAPLSPTARRAGWVGSNVLLGLLPPDARIPAIFAGRPLAPADVRRAYERTKPLKNLDSGELGWTVDVLREVRKLGRAAGETFTLREAYAASEATLAALHPSNRHVQAKMRQQMQVLRDMGILEFVPGKRGVYRLLAPPPQQP